MTEETSAGGAAIVAGDLIFPWWVLLIWGILTLLLGIMFLSTPGMTTEILVTFLGAFWLVGGLFSLGSIVVDRTNAGWKIFLAILNIIAGILILTYPFYSTVLILEFFIIVIGFWACFIGLSYLWQAFRVKDWGNGVLGVISLIFGLLLLAHPFMAAGLLPFIAGIFCIMSGISAIAASVMAAKAKPAAA